MRPRVSLWLLSLATAVGLAGCGGTAAGASPTTRVFASASLTDAFQALARAFEERHPGAELELHFAGTPRLVVQLREGAAADVFAAADTVSVERVLAGTVPRPPVRIFATNRLAIALPRGNPGGIAGLADLGRADLTVALCGPEIPAGRYARQALERAGISVRSASDEPSVRALIAKVELGELDAGVVYATDVASAARRIDSVPIPDELNVVATCPIVALAPDEDRPGGEAFVEFVLSAEGRRILDSFGFGAP